jgi:hypothetical protein
MRKALFTLCAFMASMGLYAQSDVIPPVPEVSGDNLFVLFADTRQNGMNFFDWGGGTGEDVTEGGKGLFKISNFAYFGSGFNQTNVSNYEYFHIDIYPLQDMSLGFVMINHNTEGTANEGEKGIEKSLTGNQWNSFDIPVQDYLDLDASMKRLYQFKFVSRVVKNNADPDTNDEFANGDRSCTFYVGNMYFKGVRIVDTENPELVTAEAAEVGGNSVKLKLNATDNNEDVNFKIMDGAEVKGEASGRSGEDVYVTIKNLQPETDYTFTVVATDISGNASNEKTVSFTTVVGFLPTAAPVPTKDAAMVKSIYSDAYTPATGFNYGGWGQSTAHKEETIGEDKILHLTNFNYLGFEFYNDIDLSDMAYLHIDILPRQEMQFGVTPIMRGEPHENSQSVGTLVVDKWNSIDIPLAQFGLKFDESAAFQIKFDRGDGKQDVYLDNIYFYADPNAAPYVIKVADGVASVVGKVTAEAAEEINAADVMLIELKDVQSIDEGAVISPKNPNALIAVAGTRGEPAVVDAKYGSGLDNVNNVVVRDTWLFPVKQLQLTDANGVKQWMGEGATNDGIKFISTGSIGYKVSRMLKPRAFSTVYTTSVVTEFPEGITAWEATGFDGTTISFNKANAMAAFFPYVVYNANDTETEFSFEGTGDFNLFAWSTGNVAPHAVGSASFQGNFADLTTNGAQWILQNATSDVAEGAASVVFKKGNGAIVGAFRAYFTGLTAEATAKFIGFDDVADGISNVEMKTANNGKVYSINGMEVVNSGKLDKGVYVINGKKVVIK